MGTQDQTRLWLRVQAVSGLVFLAFALMHLLNTALAALGPSAYNGFQRTLRTVYQQPFVEITFVLLPIVAHVVAGVVRMRQRKGKHAPTSLRARVHRSSGYFLLVFIGGHIGATRLPPLLRGVYPEFEGVAFTFQFLPAWFYPYYLALGLAGLLHASLGLPLALSALGVRVRSQWRSGLRFWLPVSVLAAGVLLGTAALGGLLYAVPDQSMHAFAVLVREAVSSALPRGWGPI
jgi:succinate dehydrogenase/fumarate reductase cytochrome b subunit